MPRSRSICDIRDRRSPPRRGGADRARHQPRAAASGADPHGYPGAVRVAALATGLPPVGFQSPSFAGRGNGAARWLDFPGGIHRVGHAGETFFYDNECPRHEALLRDYRLASRLVTNGEWLEFMADGGYATPGALALRRLGRGQRQGLDRRPDTGRARTARWRQMTLNGLMPVDLAAPVCHVSYFEADAFARWAGKRLPTEFEWEAAAAGCAVRGNMLGSGALRPLPAPAIGAADKPAQMFGDVWEWTQSAYCRLSRLPRRTRCARRVQRQVHVRPVRAARRLVRDAGRALARDLPQFLLPASTLAVHRRPLGRRRMTPRRKYAANTASCRRLSAEADAFGEAVLAGLSDAAQAAAVPVLLRRGRQRAVRGDHRARRVLSNAHGDGDPA